MNRSTNSSLLRIFLFTFSLIPSLLFSEDDRGINHYFTTGSLLTPSAHNTPPGEVTLQPHIFWVEEFGRFNDDRSFEKREKPSGKNLSKRVNRFRSWESDFRNTRDILEGFRSGHYSYLSTPLHFKSNESHENGSFKGSLVFGLGLLSWLDLSATLNDQTNYQKGQSSNHIGDTQVGLGFQLLREKRGSPALRLTVTESFPTGRYQKLKSGRERLETSGSGSYETSAALTIGKKVSLFNLCASFKYTIPTPVYAQGFSAYTQAMPPPLGKLKICLGKKIEVATSVELSIAQDVVLACHLVYAYQYGQNFSGRFPLPVGEKEFVNHPVPM